MKYNKSKHCTRRKLGAFTSFRLLLVFFFLICLFIFPENIKKNCAIIEFSANDVSTGEAKALTDYLRGQLVKNQQLNVLDRGNMEKILQEQAFQSTGCTDSACAVKIGQLLNMHYMIVGSLSKFGSMYVISIDMIDVETGKIVTTEQAKNNEMSDLLTDAEEIAKKISAAAYSSLRTSEGNLEIPTSTAKDYSDDFQKKEPEAAALPAVATRSFKPAKPRKSPLKEGKMNLSAEVGNGAFFGGYLEGRSKSMRIPIGEFGAGISASGDMFNSELFDQTLRVTYFNMSAFLVYHFKIKPTSRIILDFRIRGGLGLVTVAATEFTERITDRVFEGIPEICLGIGPIYAVASIPLIPGKNISLQPQFGAGLRYWK